LSWAVAVVCRPINAVLGVTSSTGIFVCTVLSVGGLSAAVVVMGTLVRADFGAAPDEPAFTAAVADGECGSVPAWAPVEPVAGTSADKPADTSAGPGA